MQQEKRPPLPPLPAFQGLACFKCFKEDVLPSQCSGCHRISYCSPECQKVDWKMHKPMCKALSAIEKINPIAAATLLSSLPSEPITDVEVLNGMAAVQISSILDFCQRSLQRPTDSNGGRHNGHDHRQFQTPDSVPTVQPELLLLACALGGCPEVRAHIKFEAVLADKNGHFARFKWAPPRVKSAWMSLTALSWEGEFDDEIRTFIGFPASFPLAPLIRAASDDLTMALTILYGLEKRVRAVSFSDFSCATQRSGAGHGSGSDKDLQK
ncbi:hypothetical protein C8R44DRAFT_861274 [Mycena epipterygia]|nr:hypothetical protein C8R44DRAFT_861274 [Mycena epipterygia]